MKKVCITCGNRPSRPSYQYCSNKCQLEYQYESYIENWKQGMVDGNRGINTKNLSGHLKRYLMKKYHNTCSQCGWNVKHLITGRVPLEIDHIDGNAENNQEENLRVLCPNCHSLTLSFKNLNIGNGRSWRKIKYNKLVKRLPS